MDSYPSVLYVWAGQSPDVHDASDFVAVVDFDEKSLTYGSILETKRINQTNNEPHHSGISSNGKYYVTGGLLSFLSKQKEIFVWDIPRNKFDGPKLKCAIDAPGACTDEFYPIGGSEFLVSMMCNESGSSPGDMVKIYADSCTAKSILKNPSTWQDFNPHGFDKLRDGSIMVGDFVNPITLAADSPTKIVFRNTCRLIRPDGTLKRTFKFEFPSQRNKTIGLGSGVGFMELKAIPNDKLSRGYALGSSTNMLYLLGPSMSEPLAVYDVSEVNGFAKVMTAGIISIFPDGKRMIMTFQMRFVILVDITRPERPKFLRVFDFCKDKSVSTIPIRDPQANVTTTFPRFCAKYNNNVGTHVIIHPKGENRFLVLNYFLKFGMAQFPGTRSVHAFKLSRELTDFSYDCRFNPNCEFHEISYDRRTTFNSLQAYPHHAQYLRV